jgi:hypothetical protein
MLIGGAGRDGLKPPGLGSNYLGEKVSTDKVNNRAAELGDS